MKTGQPDLIIIIPHLAKTIFYENPFCCRISGKKIILAAEKFTFVWSVNLFYLNY